MKYFKVQELVDKGTYERIGDKAIELFSPLALLALDNLREFFGVSVTVNNWHTGGTFQWRGYRTLAKAKELGSSKSEHAQGNAFDCDISGYTAEKARIKIIENKDDPFLVLINRLESGVNWVHFDLKPVTNRIHIFKA